MKKDGFSVAISVYAKDNAEHFDRALESITDLQSIKPDEIVLIVDGPINDDLNRVIEKYENRYSCMKTIRLEQNGGLGNALRIAVEACEHELIARMDSDDVARPTRFEEQLQLFQNDRELDVAGGDIAEFIGTEENIVAYRRVPRTNAEIKAYMKVRCPFNHGTVMYKKSAVEKAGGYLDLFWNEDYFLWIRMELCGVKFANTGTILMNFRAGEDLYARRGGKRYFESEKYLQKYMLEHKMIGPVTYVCNVSKRWIVQRCLPNKLRGWVFRKFARTNT